VTASSTGGRLATALGAASLLLGGGLLAVHAGWLERFGQLQVSMTRSETAAVYLSPVFWGLTAAILVVEALWPVDRAQPLFSRAFFQDALYFAVNMGLRVVVLSAYVGLLRAGYDRWLDGLTLRSLAGWPAPARLVLAVLVVDFLAWFHHWVRHKVPVFWRLHAVHHAQPHLNLFTDLRYHPLEYLVTVTLVALPLFVLQHAFPIVFAMALFQQWYPRLYHANIRSDFGWVRHLLVTPQFHRIHHSIEPRHRDLNYGVIFSFWDRLLGTADRGPREYPTTGIADPGFPLEQDTRHGLLGALAAQCLHPFWPRRAGSLAAGPAPPSRAGERPDF